MSDTKHLFVYGTLRNLDLMRAVAGGAVAHPKAASLAGFEVFMNTDGIYPVMIRAENGSASGQLYSGLNTRQLQRLDLFEGTETYSRQSVEVMTEDGPVVAQAYLGASTVLPTAAPWSLSAWEEDHLAPTILAVSEAFDFEDLPDQAEFDSAWPMIERRAWAKHRAQTQTASVPATIRHSAEPDDVSLLSQEERLGGFFRLQAFDVDHLRFDGRRSERLRREVLIGVDAALVLPYDPTTQSVLLVEQVRMGPFRRGDKNPWQLEPVAGMTDARETAQEAAIREAKEEAGLSLERLDRMFGIYPSPGNATDYFECFCAPTKLPEQGSFLGGLEDEHEDLRLHVLPLTQALDLIETSEVSVAPLVAMLYWLDRNKARYA